MKFRILLFALAGWMLLQPVAGRAAYPIITNQPDTITNVLGDPFEFIVSADDPDYANQLATGSGYGYQWRRNGTNIVNPDGDGFGDFLKLVSTNTDVGTYSCRISNYLGQAVTSAPAVLTLWYPPVITNQPKAKVIGAGSNVTFTVQVNKSLSPTNFTYQWEQDGFDTVDDGVHVTGSMTPTLTLTDVQYDDAGEYTVNIYNDATDASVSAPGIPIISTNATLTVVVPPIITFQPDSQEVVEGDYVLFYVVVDEATTDTPEYPLTYQWKKWNGVATYTIPNATNNYYELPQPARSPEDELDYTVVIANYAGVVTSDMAHLTVDVPPIIGVQPLNKNVAFTDPPFTNKIVISAGTMPMDIQWYFNNTLIEGATNTTYVLVPQNTNQSGLYSVFVQNVAGFDVSDDALVNVRADFDVPTVSISHPGDNVRVTAPVVDLSGIAHDVYSAAFPRNLVLISQIQLRNNGGPMSNAVLGPWTTNTTSGTLTWTLSLPAVAGSNYFEAFSTDLAGNVSAPSFRHVFYVVTSPFTLLINGSGTINSNNLGGSNLLEIGRSYTLIATNAATNKFLLWSNSVTLATTTGTNLTFLMQTNLTITAYFAETNRPTLAITNPANNANLTNNGGVIVQGTATDNVRVAAVMWQLNGGAWSAATGTNNWSASITPAYGTNLFRAYSVDNSINYSTTNTLSFTNTSIGVLIVKTNGQGSILTNLNGQSLIFGKTYSMTAATNAGSGYAFTNWTGGTNVTLPVLTSATTLNFVMKSNLTLQANFSDNQKPTLIITNALPTVVTSLSATVRGSAADNDRIVTVMYQLNSGGWMTAAGTNDWSAPVTLLPGNNSFAAYSVDAAGNKSAVDSASSTVAILAPPILSLLRTNNQTIVRLNSITGATYRLLSSTGLVSAAWITNATASGDGTQISLTDTNTPPALRYYRVRADVP